MKRIGLILLIIALCGTLALAESPTLAPAATPQPTATPQPAGEVFSCETLIVTLPEGFALLEDAETAGYTAAVEDAYQTEAQLLFAAQNDINGAICMAMIEDNTAALDACRAAAENILGSADNAGEYVYGENSYAGFACALDSSVYQIYFISDGAHLVMISTANLSVEETAYLLQSLVI